MNEDIMTLSNELIYHGKLKCGNQDVRVKTLTLPKLDEAMKVIHAEFGGEGGKCVGADGDACWLEKVVDPR
jgi:DNA replication ATP-dependent helicase Dna2